MSNDKVLNDLLKDKLEDAGIAAKSTGTDSIVCIVDRSGSMSAIRKDAEGGLNTFINDQKKIGAANLTIVEFDNKIEMVCEQIDINDAKEYSLKPRGMTALLDAIGTVVSQHEKYDTKDGKTIIAVITDGGENSSREWDRDSVFKMINERKEAGWEFMFLASGQDAINVGMQYGFDKNSTMSFANSAEGVQDAYMAQSVYTTSLRTMSKGAALKSKADFIASKSETLSDTGEVK